MSKFYNLNKFCRFNQFFSVALWRPNHKVRNVGSNILETEIKTAIRVAKLIFELHLARVEQPDDLEAFIRHHVYEPKYQTLV